jgi:glyoxalase family protein
MTDSRGPVLPGMHHVTAICGDPQRNLEFYGGLLGLKLVKKTVNFDDPGSYHLYYGNGVGSPGTLITFFAWIGLPPMATSRGRRGTGQIGSSAFRVPAESIGYWVNRLAAAAVEFDGPEARFGADVLTFRDPDGLELEIVGDPGTGLPAPWERARVPAEHAIRGLHGVSISLLGYEKTAELLTVLLGFEEDGREGERIRFRLGEGRDRAILDVLVHSEASPGRMGIGGVHHVAWRTPTRDRQDELRQRLLDAGFDVTPILDRRYFQSIYFREPGGVIFEVATDEPGFTVDEPEEELGRALRLPPWLESRRERIESRLPALRLPY